VAGRGGPPFKSRVMSELGAGAGAGGGVWVAGGDAVWAWTAPARRRTAAADATEAFMAVTIAPQPMNGKALRP